MILLSNLPRLRELAGAAERVLDAGGWYQPFNLATQVVDLMPYATRRTGDALDPEDAERFTAETWLDADVSCPPWPYPDKFFDFAICSHLIEDVRDPIAVCGELNRVARSGYVETPSRRREIFSKQRLFASRALRGSLPEIGHYHHRWFVEAEGAHLRLTAKTGVLTEDRRHYLTRGDLGRNLTEAERGLGFFWERGFTYEEVFADPREDYPFIRRKALARLTDR